MPAIFGMFTGTVANAALIVAGTLIGVLFKANKLKAVGERVFQAFALFVIIMGVSGAMDLSQPLLELASLIIGIAAGELLDIDGKFRRFADFLQKKFVKGENSHFGEGFVSATLLFCIGSMTFLGALEAGMQGGHTIYLTKGVLDGLSAVTFAMGAGIGVAFSAIPVLIYQGLLVVLASVLAPILTAETISLTVAVGSLFLIAIGTNMLGITKIKVANFLPAMFVPMIWQALSLFIKHIMVYN